MRISDWSSDVCSSDLRPIHARQTPVVAQLLEDRRVHRSATLYMRIALRVADPARAQQAHERRLLFQIRIRQSLHRRHQWRIAQWLGEYHRPDEHKSELQSLMRTSYALFCLKTSIQRSPA